MREFASNGSSVCVCLENRNCSSDKEFPRVVRLYVLANDRQREMGNLSKRVDPADHNIEDCPIPVVAAITGWALGGGLEIAMMCHGRVCSKNAKVC